MMLSESQAVAALAALAQDTRLRLFRLLVGAGPAGLSPGDVLQPLGVSPATVSFHLKELEQAGLVLSQRQGRHIHYRVCEPAMNGLLAYLTAHCCQGQPCGIQPVQRLHPME